MDKKEKRRRKPRAIGKKRIYMENSPRRAKTVRKRKHPDTTLKELKEDLGFVISTIWYRLKQLKIRLKKSHWEMKNTKKKTGKNLEKELPR